MRLLLDGGLAWALQVQHQAAQAAAAVEAGLHPAPLPAEPGLQALLGLRDRLLRPAVPVATELAAAMRAGIIPAAAQAQLLMTSMMTTTTAMPNGLQSLAGQLQAQLVRLAVAAQVAHGQQVEPALAGLGRGLAAVAAAWVALTGLRCLCHLSLCPLESAPLLRRQQEQHGLAAAAARARQRQLLRLLRFLALEAAPTRLRPRTRLIPPAAAVLAAVVVSQVNRRALSATTATGTTGTRTAVAAAVVLQVELPLLALERSIAAVPVALVRQKALH